MSNMEFRLDQPSAPLEGDLHINGLSRELFGQEFVESVYAALRFEKGAPPVYNAEGRNYYIPLPRAIGPYDALQVAGGGNFDLGVRSNGEVEDGIVTLDREDEASRVILPPSEDAGLFTGHTTYYEGGEFVPKENVNPVGSYTARSAERKIEWTKRAFQVLAPCGVFVPKYLGRFEYGIPDQFGDPQTAILMLVPKMGGRFDDTLLLPLTVHINGGGPEPGEKFSAALKAYYGDALAPQLVMLGAGLATAHEAGLNHNQPTPGNMDVLFVGEVGPQPYITDWDTATVPDISERSAAQAMDIDSALQTACAGVRRMAKMELIDETTYHQLVIGTINSWLSGYAAGKGLDPRAVFVRPEDALNIGEEMYSPKRALEVIQSWFA